MSMWRPSLEKILGCLVGVGILALLLSVAPRLSQPEPLQKAAATTNHTPRSVLLPLVAFEPEELDAGKLLQNETVTRTFRLRNRSDHSMQVVEIRTTCDCALVDTNLLGKTLGPRSEITVPVQFNSSTRSGPMTSLVEVTLRSNATNYWGVRGFLKVLVVPDFTYEPRSVEFGQVRPGERATLTVHFKPQALVDLSLTPMHTWRGPFEVVVRDLIATVTFHAPAIAHSETYSQVMHVSTSSPRVPQVTISLSGQVIPEVEVVPPVLVFSAGEPAGVSRLTVRAGKPFRVVRLLQEGPHGREPLPLVSPTAASVAEWALSHILLVTNRTIIEADRLDLELQFQHGADRPGAQSVSVNIKRLGKTSQATEP